MPAKGFYFEEMTELYECDLTNKLALEHRALHRQKARLTKSVGFSVVENDFLRGVLEFSSEGFEPLDEWMFRAISKVGFQLGHVLAREHLTLEYNRAPEQMLSQEGHCHAMSRLLFSGPGSLPGVVEALEFRKQTRRAIARSSTGILESTCQMRQCLEELKRIIVRPVEFRPDKNP